MTIQRRLAEMFWVAGGMATARLATLAASVLAARLLDVDAFGKFTLFVTVALLVADLGRPIDNAFVRETVGRDAGEAASYFRFSIYLKLVLIILAVLVGGAWILLTHADESTTQYAVAGALVVGALLSLCYSVQAHFQRRRAVVGMGLVDPLTASALLSATIYVATVGTPSVARIVNVALVISAVVALATLAWAYTNSPTRRITGGERKRFLGVVWVFFSSGAILQVGARLDTFLVAAMSTLTSLGYYGAAARVAGPVGMLGAGAGMLLLPEARGALESRDGLIDFGRRALVYSLVQVAVLAALVALSEPIVVWLFGRDFISAVEILQWLLLARLLSAATVPFRVLLQASSRPGRLVELAAVKVAVGALSIGLLVPQFGGVGAAVGMCLGEFAGLTLAVLMVSRTWHAARRTA